MRVLIGTESFHPAVSGVSIAVSNLARYLVNKGHKVMVVAPSYTGESFKEGYPDGFQVWRVTSVPNPFRSNFRMTVFPGREIRSLLDQWRPDVIHVQDPNAISLALIRAARIRGLPVVISHHFTFDYILSYLRMLKSVQPYIRKGLAWRVIDIYNSCQYVVCPSETVKQQLLKAGLKTPVVAISNGVDMKRFFPPARAEHPSYFGLPDMPIALYVGRIDLEKNLETLVDAVPLVLDCCKVHFVLCGDGQEVKSLKRRAARRGILNHISFLGPIQHSSPDLPRIYHTANCFVNPSPVESQSIVTLEAMAAGLPVIAAKACALPELVVPGYNGFLFEPGDPVDLAMKITALLQNQELCRHMGRCSLEKVMQHELETSLRKIEEVYARVIMNETA